MDETDRDKFYSATSDDADDGEDYELEPPDAEVLAAEERRGKEAIEATKMSIDIDEIYRDVDRDRGQEILEDWTRNFRFRFQVKHLLIGTAVLAIVLTLARLDMLFTTVVLLIMVSVAGLFFYLQWQERKQQQQAERRRREMYERRRAFLERTTGATGGAATTVDVPDAQTAAMPTVELDEQIRRSQDKPQFRFHFSLLELMGAMTVAALILGLVHLMGGASPAATVLGFIALFGLVVHAMGFEPPEIVVLGWWLILVLYVLLSIFAAMWSSFA